MFYDYQCENCGNIFELQQPPTAPTTATCPLCCQNARRMFPINVGVVYKGTGFYSTDYRKKNINEKMVKTDGWANPETPTTD